MTTNPMRRLTILHRAALGRWKANGSAANKLRGPADAAAYDARVDRMNALADAMWRIQREMWSL